jgi:hypothetical protein
LVIEFQNRGSKHDHELLWIKNAFMYGVHTNEEIERFVNMYISCDVSLLPNLVQNAQQCQNTHRCKKKNHVVYNICDVHLWFANINISFNLDPYAIATYCTSYMTKIDKSITS